MNERSTTRSDYAIRLERVFGWLADHLDDDRLDFAVLAEVACMSPYHFHRIYHAMQGETAADTVRRLRLHRAAVELITGELPVARIARRDDDPSSTPREALRADACVTVPDGMTPSGELQLREIRGGRYAVTLHVGPYAELHIPYTWLYGTWLPQSGEEAADAPSIEEYLNDARIVPASELRTEIWLPLR